MNQVKQNDVTTTSEVMHVSDADFQEKVVNSSVPVLVDLWAPWCGPCRILGPVLEQVAAEVSGKAIVAKLNVDENPAVASALRVQAIPMLVLFNEGKVVNVMTGVRPKQDLIQFIESAYQ